mgnify:CR=1 FL=1
MILKFRRIQLESLRRLRLRLDSDFPLFEKRHFYHRQDRIIHGDRALCAADNYAVQSATDGRQRVRDQVPVHAGHV